MKLRIGTRGSKLALWQADHVALWLHEASGGTIETERLIFKTRGDAILDRPLAEIGGKGLFTKELEVALAAGDIDIAVHSLKDMPTKLPPGLVLGSIPKRGDVRDAWITRKGEGSATPSTVGTASLRRACLVKRRFADAHVEPIRGNVQTRLQRVHDAPPRRVDAVVLAWVGLDRIGLTARDDVLITPIDAETWIPAVGQGALAIECREGDAATLEALGLIHHAPTARAVIAERAFLRGVEGDCRVPVGGHAVVEPDGSLLLRAFVGAPDGSEFISEVARGSDAEALGQAVAERLMAAGGAKVLAALRG
jgi:hydroxymethylbilane synthase